LNSEENRTNAILIGLQAAGRIGLHIKVHCNYILLTNHTTRKPWPAILKEI